MLRLIRTLRNEGSGPSIDWVVLTAAIVGLCLVILAGVRGSGPEMERRIEAGPAADLPTFSE